MRRLGRRGLSSATASAPQHYDVLINGGGIVGAVFAADLLRALGPGSKIKIGIVDPRKPPTLESCVARTSPDLRVYAMSPKSVEILDSIGSWKHISPRSQPYDAMQVWESGGIGMVRFNARDSGMEQLGWIVEDSTVQAAIYQSLADQGFLGSNVDLLFGRSVTKLSISPPDASSAGARHMAQVTLSEHLARGKGEGEGAAKDVVATARLVLGADGPASAVRRLSGGATWGWGYGQEAVVATVKVDASSHGSTAWQRYLPSGPLALLPLWDGYSSIVWSAPVAEAQRLSSLPADDFVSELNAALGEAPRSDRWSVLEPSDAPFPGPMREVAALADAAISAALLNARADSAFAFPPKITALASARVTFPLQFQQAQRYCSPRVALLGDAAHSIHPQAGQGLNLGIADARALATVVYDALAAGGDIGDAALLRRAYGLPQYTNNLFMMGAVDGLNSLFSYTGPGARALSFLRGAGMVAVNALDPLKTRIVKTAAGSGGSQQ